MRRVTHDRCTCLLSMPIDTPHVALSETTLTVRPIERRNMSKSLTSHVAARYACSAAP